MMHLTPNIIPLLQLFLWISGCTAFHPDSRAPQSNWCSYVFNGLDYRKPTVQQKHEILQRRGGRVHNSCTWCSCWNLLGHSYDKTPKYAVKVVMNIFTLKEHTIEQGVDLSNQTYEFPQMCWWYVGAADWQASSPRQQKGFRMDT